MIGIYKITNLINNKCYIGQSIDIDRRWKQHLYMLNSNKHHSIKLQNSWNKYKNKNFKFEVIEECEYDCLDEKENFHIELNDSKFNGYNMNGEYNIEYKNDLDSEFEIIYNKWNDLLLLRDENINNFYFYDLKFNLRNSNNLKKIIKILTMTNSIYEALLVCDKDKIYSLTKINFAKNGFELMTGFKKYPNKLNCFKDLLLEFIYSLYYNKKYKKLLNSLETPLDLFYNNEDFRSNEVYDYILKHNYKYRNSKENRLKL